MRLVHAERSDDDQSYIKSMVSNSHLTIRVPRAVLATTAPEVHPCLPVSGTARPFKGTMKRIKKYLGGSTYSRKYTEANVPSTRKASAGALTEESRQRCERTNIVGRQTDPTNADSSAVLTAQQKLARVRKEQQAMAEKAYQLELEVENERRAQERQPRLRQHTRTVGRGIPLIDWRARTPHNLLFRNRIHTLSSAHIFFRC